MMPIGGTKKPPIISPTETKKQIANVMRHIKYVRGSSAFSLLIAFTAFVIFIYPPTYRSLHVVGFTLRMEKLPQLPYFPYYPHKHQAECDAADALQGFLPPVERFLDFFNDFDLNRVWYAIHFVNGVRFYF